MTLLPRREGWLERQRERERERERREEEREKEREEGVKGGGQNLNG